MADTIRWMSQAELITEITHASELLDNWKIEDARLFVKNLCAKLAEHAPQLDSLTVTEAVVHSYLNGVISLLEIREVA